MSTPKRIGGLERAVVAIGCGVVALLICTVSWSAEDEPATVTEVEQGPEVKKLYAGMVTFREKFTAFPLSTNDEKRVTRFVTKAFPRARRGTLPKALDAAEALPYWLSQVSTNERQPFEAKPDDRFLFFTFADSRLKDGRYYPTSDKKTDPYVYLSWDSYGMTKYKDFEPYYVPDDKAAGGKRYLAPETCQIIGPGKDGRGGSLKGLADEDRDNVVSFAKVVVGEIEVEE